MEPLIEAVRRYPCLWNTAAIEYRDQELKDAAWAEVMKESELSSLREVKLKWKKLRDSYRDALKRQGELAARGPGAGAAKRGYPWKYMALMQFLQPHMSARKKPAESPPARAPPPLANGRRSDSESASGASSRSPRRARRSAERLGAIDRKLELLCRARAERRRAAPPAPDALDTFFAGMCQATRRLPFPAQLKIKRALFGCVMEAEEALLAEQQSYAALWAAGGAAGAGAGGSSSSDSDEKPS